MESFMGEPILWSECSFSFYIYICISSFHSIKAEMTVCHPFRFWTHVYIWIHVKFYRTTSLYMLDSWRIIYAQFYLWLLDLFLFFSYTNFYFRKKRWSILYRFRALYDSFGDGYHAPNPCFNRYLYSIHLYVYHFNERLRMCVCVRVCILLCKNEFCMYVFIVGQ